jgi:hypothetical protein
MKTSIDSKMQAEIARVPIGSSVKARSAPGLGVGVVREHITELKGRDGSTIPHHGFVEARVAFADDFGDVVETFKTGELSVVR